MYARVSTNGHGQTVEPQLLELREYCQRRDWTVAGEYVDAGISGAKDSRAELNRLVADAHKRRFDAVIVWKFDRFARSVSHLLRALETFQALGIAFVSLSEQTDTTIPAGKMVFTVLGAVAELKRSLIAERVKAGLRNAKAKGREVGRPRMAVDAARIAALRTQGHSWPQIARELGLSLSEPRTAPCKGLSKLRNRLFEKALNQSGTAHYPSGTTGPSLWSKPLLRSEGKTRRREPHLQKTGTSDFCHPGAGTRGGCRGSQALEPGVSCICGRSGVCCRSGRSPKWTLDGS